MTTSSKANGSDSEKAIDDHRELTPSNPHLPTQMTADEQGNEDANLADLEDVHGLSKSMEGNFPFSVARRKNNKKHEADKLERQFMMQVGTLHMSSSLSQ